MRTRQKIQPAKRGKCSFPSWLFTSPILLSSDNSSLISKRWIRRFHVELHFSPGVNCCVQKELPPGPGFRPHSRNHEQVFKTLSPTKAWCEFHCDQNCDPIMLLSVVCRARKHRSTTGPRAAPLTAETGMRYIRWSLFKINPLLICVELTLIITYRTIISITSVI